MQRTYLVIAAGSAIGSCVARRLAADGAALVLAARDPSRVAALAADLGGWVVQADATSFEDVERCARDAAARTGRLDGVLNCAGSILLKPAHLTTADELSQVLTTNLVSAFATLRAAALVMRPTASAVHWLLGPDCAWVTGQVIGVDGGLADLKGRVRQ